MDDLTYSYDSGNKLLKVEDTANDTYGFKDDAINTADNSDDYSYDSNGNMLSDTNKGITGMAYNYLNLPVEIIFNNDPNRKISYIYSADGIKQQKVVTDNAVITTTGYAGSYIYENSSLKFISHAEGYIEPDGAGGYAYVYQYKDHLGNVRLSYSDSNHNGGVDNSEIIEENNYYPFGLLHKGYNNQVNGTENKFFTYNGVEQEEALGLNMYEFDLRHYDAVLGRFITPDPYEQFHSPYLAMGNNPVVSFDPDGGYCYDSNGNQIACPGKDDFYVDYRDNPNNHITILDEVVLTPSGQSPVEEVETEAPEIVGGEKFMDVDAEAMLAAIVATATVTSQLDGPEPGLADVVAAGEVLGGLAFLSLLLQTEDFVNRNQATIESLFNSASDNSKNEKHGDGGKALENLGGRLAELETQLANAKTKKEKDRIKIKIRRERQNAEKKKKGEEHSRGKKQ